MAKESEDNVSRREKLAIKLSKNFGDDLVDTLQSATREELKDRLSTLAKHEDETNQSLEENEKIVELKEELKELTGPYRDTLKGIAIQRSFIAVLMAEKGSAKT